ncbi:site-specific integrase [Colwellia sp. MEBiC06753]
MCNTANQLQTEQLETQSSGMKLREVFSSMLLSGKKFLSSLGGVANLDNTLSAANDAQVQETPENYRLDALIERFLMQKQREVKAATITHYEISFKFLMATLGESFDIRKLKRSTAVDVFEELQLLPANHTKNCSQIKPLAVKTVNRYMVNFSTFCDWVVNKEKGLVTNPFKGLRLKSSKNTRAHRRPYTNEELSRIWHYQVTDAREAPGIREDIRWIPKIAMYTGMRLSEIASLYVHNVTKFQGIWVITLGETSIHNVKNWTSLRIVPIHSRLIEAGFIDFVNERKADDQKYLFSQVYAKKQKSSQDGFGVPVSRWFNRTLLRKVGVDKEELYHEKLMVDFHCFRTTVASFYKRAGEQAYIVRQLLGHLGDTDVTFGIYGSQVTTDIQVLKDVIEKLDY